MSLIDSDPGAQLVDLTSPTFTGDMIFRRQHAQMSSTYTQTQDLSDPPTCTGNVDGNVPSHMGGIYNSTRSVSFGTDLPHRHSQSQEFRYDTMQPGMFSIPGPYPRPMEPRPFSSYRDLEVPVTPINTFSDRGNTYTPRGVVGELNMNLPSLNTTSLVNASASTYPATYIPGTPFGPVGQSRRTDYAIPNVMTPISSRDPLLTPRPTYESQIYTEPRTVITTPSYNVDSSRMGPMEPNSMGFNQSVNTPLNLSGEYAIPRKNKAFEPETFDGSPMGTEWSEYIIHFEQIAQWNNWSDLQRAQALTIKLRGEAQKLLSSLTYAQFMDYNTLKRALSQRFNPEEREIAYRCEFKNRKRMKNEQPSDYGYILQRLGRKAYPNMPYSALEVHILDQFIMGLGCLELQKHVQFHHPKTLEQAINLATEYKAVCKNLDKIVKPALTEPGETTSSSQIETAPTVTSLRQIEKPSFTLDDLEKVVKRVVEQTLLDSPNQGGKKGAQPPSNKTTHTYGGPKRGKVQSPKTNYQAEATHAQNKSEVSHSRNNPQEPRKPACSYCGRDNHVETRCWVKLRDLEAQTKQTSNPLN